MLQAIFDFLLCWCSALVCHEAAHAVVGRWVGMEVVGINLFCRTDSSQAGIFNGRVLFEGRGVSWGLSLLCGGCVVFNFDADTPRLHRVAVKLAGPVANGLLAAVLGLQGDMMALVVNVFYLCTCYSDVSTAVDLYVTDMKRNLAVTACAFALMAMPLLAVCASMGGWYYALVVFAVLSYAGAMLNQQTARKTALAVANA